MSKSHPAAQPIDELLKDCVFQRTRRGGPGGQHRNKTESAIVVTHAPTGVSAQAGERRSQHENRRVAIDRLRVNLAMEIRIELANQVIPSERWKSRVRNSRLEINPAHSDFPGLLAEALDTIAEVDFELAAAAEKLIVSSSQLIKLLKLHPPALVWLNQQRQKRDLRPLK